MSFPKNRPVIFEFHIIGNCVKVTAFDEQSLTEIVIQAPIGTHEDILKKNALNRLEYVLRKKKLIN